MIPIRALVLLALALAALAGPHGESAVAQQLPKRHGIAMHGEPALGPGFTHFPYVDPAARKGGRLSLGRLGTFDSLNPFIVRGSVPTGVREYVYESLLARNLDEPFSLYGLIAAAIEVPDDRTSITFHLRPEARFSDGRAITAKDVLFSYEVLREKGFPYHRSYYGKVAKAEALGEHVVRFDLGSGSDRELPLILGLMPVLPSHLLTMETFDRTTLEPVVGSGPYVVDKVDPGRAVIYKRDAKHWARDLPVYKGRFNAEEVRIEYFRESSTMMEAFKTGQLDLRVEDDPSTWAEGYTFPAATDGRVLKREIAIGAPAGLAALVMNTRRSKLADPRVRRALILAFDFEWINANLYHGLYARSASLFERSHLSAAGKPASDAERKLLGAHSADIKPEILAGTWKPPASDGSGSNRDNLKAAVALLAQAGYRLERDGLKDARGEPLEIEFLAANRGQERLVLAYRRALERIGVKVAVRQADSSQYWQRVKSFDFDMIQWTWGSSLSPGNEQANRWASRSAASEGSLNYAGVKNAAVDAMIDALLAARGAEDFTAAARALDRAVMSGDYVIPLFHAPRQWIAHWRHVVPPPRTPLSGIDIDTWWIEDKTP